MIWLFDLMGSVSCGLMLTAFILFAAASRAWIDMYRLLSMTTSVMKLWMQVGMP